MQSLKLGMISIRDNNHMANYKRLPICVYDSWKDEKGHLDDHPREYVGVPEDKLPYKPLPKCIAPGELYQGVYEHTHRELEIAYAVSGMRLHRINGRMYQVNPSDMCITNPFDRHTEYFYHRDYPYFTYITIFNPTDFASTLPSEEAKILQNVCSGKLRFRTLNRSVGYLQPLFESMFENYKHDNASRLLSDVYRLIAELIENYLDDAPSDINPDFEFVSQIADLVDSRYAEDLTTASVCEELSYSKSYFCRRFRESFGMSFSEYLNRLRIREATRMRPGNGLSLSDIAASCGFEDYAYFSRVFSKYCGMSPSSFFRSQGE